MVASDEMTSQSMPLKFHAPMHSPRVVALISLCPRFTKQIPSNTKHSKQNSFTHQILLTCITSTIPPFFPSLPTNYTALACLPSEYVGIRRQCDGHVGLRKLSCATPSLNNINSDGFNWPLAISYTQPE